MELSYALCSACGLEERAAQNMPHRCSGLNSVVAKIYPARVSCSPEETGSIHCCCSKSPSHLLGRAPSEVARPRSSCPPIAVLRTAKLGKLVCPPIQDHVLSKRPSYELAPKLANSRFPAYLCRCMMTSSRLIWYDLLREWLKFQVVLEQSTTWTKIALW